MLIREVKVEELPMLQECATAFYAASSHLHEFKMDLFSATWKPQIERGVGVIFGMFEGDRIVGTIGGLVSGDLYSGEPYSIEFFYYVLPEFRGTILSMKLYFAFERWSRERECSYIQMAALADSMPEEMAEMYRRLGFNPVEVTYRKELA